MLLDFKEFWTRVQLYFCLEVTFIDHLCHCCFEESTGEHGDGNLAETAFAVRLAEDNLHWCGWVSDQVTV